MLRFWGDDHVLNTFYLGTSSSRSDDVEWFTGLTYCFLNGQMDAHTDGEAESNMPLHFFKVWGITKLQLLSF